MKRYNTHSLRRLSVALVAALCGCTTMAALDDVESDREQLKREKANLEERVAMLEEANASLDSERLALIDRMEDLREAKVSFESDVVRLRRSEAQLSEKLAVSEAVLAAREEALAAREQELAKLRGAYVGLVEDLEAEVASGQIQIEQLREGLTLKLSQEVMFESGSAQLVQGGAPVLRAVAQRLQALPNRVEVHGHTDDVALVGSALYPSNWELAAARSARVVRMLAEFGVSPDRLSVVSFGEYAPIASNDTPEGRAMNRRIEIRLEPVAESAPAAEAAPLAEVESPAAP
jgi:chemotaxis protein MotB